MKHNRHISSGQGSKSQSRINNYSDASQRRSASFGLGGDYKRPARRRLPVALLIFIDIVVGALILLVFYVTNYVIDWQTTPSSLPKPTSHASATTAVPSDHPSDTLATTAQPKATPSPAVDLNDWRVKFKDKFTDGTVEQTDSSYKNANINVSINKVQENGVTYYVADIYVAELKYFKTAFPKNSDKMGGREFTDVIAREINAIIAVNGDHCVDNPGPVVRNGKSYRLNEKAADALVMNYDGSMQTFSASELDLGKIKTEGAWQVWTFGPMLLKDGLPMTVFDLPDQVGGANPRTAIGYYEPGHYCFVVVDGRQPGYSNGMDIKQLSQLFYSLGCTVAFNLDGGQSSEMAFMGKMINQPYNGGRSTTDILYIG
jgi:exopolysaccharide biosynthesis protein